MPCLPAAFQTRSVGETHCPFPVRLTYEPQSSTPQLPSRPRASLAGRSPGTATPLRGRRGAGYTRTTNTALTRVPVSSRPQSLHRLRTATASATSARAAQQPTYVGPPARLQQLPTTATRRRVVVPAASAGLPAKSSEARGGHHHTPRPQINKPESLSTSRRRAMVGPMKTSCYHSTISEWPSSNRPDFPPASPCGNREFWADVPHRNRDHQTYGAVRRVHSFFPYNVTDARRWVLCAARYVFLQRTFKPRGDRVGALGGQYGRRSTPRQLRCHRPTPRQLGV